jgi:hypothetical protein
MSISPIHPTLPTTAGETPCRNLCGARRPEGGSIIPLDPAVESGPPPVTPAPFLGPETEPIPAGRITRPFTLEPIIRQVRDSITEMIEELEAEGNLEPETSLLVFQAVAEILNDEYGPAITRRALRAVLPTIQ